MYYYLFNIYLFELKHIHCMSPTGFVALTQAHMCNKGLSRNDTQSMYSMFQEMLKGCACAQQLNAELRIKIKLTMHHKRELCWLNTSDIQHSASHKHI